jgi:adenylate kinase
MQLEIMQSQLLPVRDNATTVILTGIAGTGATACIQISYKMLLMKRSVENLR